VEAIADVEQPPPAFLASRRVTIRIVEAFRGVAGETVEIFTGRGGGDCGYAFHAGGAYLVYARRSRQTGQLTTSICSRTMPLERAADDLEYARSVQAMPAGVAGRILGTVLKLDRDALGDVDSRVPMQGITIVASTDGVSRSAVTDRSGRFEISGLHVGAYDVHAELTEGLYSPGPAPAALADVRACREINFYVSDDGRVSGRLVDADGRGIPGATIELSPRETLDKPGRFPTARIRTDEDGRYELTKAPPGRYVIVVSTPRLYHPGVLEDRDATDVDLGAGARVSLGDLVVPRAVRFSSIAGTVRFEDGSPATGAKVYLRSDSDPARIVGLAAIVDAEGRFGHAVVAGARYRVLAELSARHGDEFVVFRSDEQPVVVPGEGLVLDFVLRAVR
jgi:hypothetical protein